MVDIDVVFGTHMTNLCRQAINRAILSEAGEVLTKKNWYKEIKSFFKDMKCHGSEEGHDWRRKDFMIVRTDENGLNETYIYEDEFVARCKITFVRDYMTGDHGLSYMPLIYGLLDDCLEWQEERYYMKTCEAIGREDDQEMLDQRVAVEKDNDFWYKCPFCEEFFDVAEAVQEHITKSFFDEEGSMNIDACKKIFCNGENAYDRQKKRENIDIH